VIEGLLGVLHDLCCEAENRRMLPRLKGGKVKAPAQLFMGAKPSRSKFTPVKNRYVKPTGGLWTSTYHEGGSAWAGSSMVLSRGEAWILHPKAAKVAIVDSLSDLKKLMSVYQHQTRVGEEVLDFEAMSKDYDAMHLTERGQNATRMVPMGEPDLYGWDVESTLWFRWKFDSVEGVEA